MTDYYEQKALWDRSLTEQEKERIDLVADIIPDDVVTILDAGCGSGTLSNYLQGYEIVGIDRSKAALKHYKHKQVCGSLDELEFQDDEFDLVVCSDVLEHLPDEIFNKTVKELKRVSKSHILIISPNKEDLVANQCKCRVCSTIFHMNLHIRSLGIDDIVTLFSDEFSPLLYTYFGEHWSSDPPLKYNLKHSQSTGYKYWDHAVCPICSSTQPEVKEDHSEIDILVNSKLDGFFNHSTEVLVLMTKSAKKGTHFDFDQLINGNDYFLSPEKISSVSRIHRQYINTADKMFFQPVTRFYPSISYLVCNAENNWIKSVRKDGTEYIQYANNSSPYGHALFVMPWLHEKQTLFVSFIDIESSESIAINVFCLEKGFINVLTIFFEGTGDEKTVSASLPEKVIPSNEGLQFEVVTNTRSAPMQPVSLLELYLDVPAQTIILDPPEQKSFCEKDYYLYSLGAEQTQDERCYSLPIGTRLYDSTYKCFFWNHDNTFECSNPISRPQYGNIMQSFNIDTIRIYHELDKLRKDHNELVDELKNTRKSLSDTQKDLCNTQKDLCNTQIDLYNTNDSLYNISNTVDHALFKMNHPLVFLRNKINQRWPKKERIDSAIRMKKHLVILTPDVKIDRRTVQMCQSIIKQFDIRCTIIAALKGEDSFSSKMLRVKRVVPGETGRYFHKKNEWHDNLNTDLQASYWLHAQFLYMAMEEDADYLMCCDLPVLPAATYAAQKKDIPLIYDAHELYPEQAIFVEEKQTLYKKVENEFIQYPNLVITVNQSIAKEMADRYGIREPNVILNALDSPNTFDIDKKYDYFREQLPIAQHEKIVLFQGGYSPNRNLELFVESAEYIQNSNVVLVLMGFGEFQKDLEKIAEESNTLNTNVFFFPAVDQSVLLEYSASADVGIIPYPHIDRNSYFCTPNKLFEFIQAGLPMITNDSPELNRFVKNNRIGCARKISNSQDIAEIIDEYFEEDIDYRSNILDLRKKICWTVEEEKLNVILKDAIFEK